MIESSECSVDPSDWCIRVLPNAKRANCLRYKKSFISSIVISSPTMAGNNGITFDSLMILCQSSSSSDSSGDEEDEELSVDVPPIIRDGSCQGKAVKIDRKR